ncbi:hypothetical protein HDU81_004658 [Chytriomyces hyalinus]|nr:hypothetical protein HDU81_004658 [Chytriomyces hyalinus]
MPRHQQTWSVGSWLSPVSGPKPRPANTPHALVVLNQPVCSVKYLEAMWKRAAVKLCADGGANRLYDSLPTDEIRQKFLPQMIKGDLDSLRSDVREFYESHGVRVILDQDLYSTDFGKCVAEIERIESESNGSVYHDIIAFGALGGRFDQTMASIHMAYKYAQQEKAQGKSKLRQIYLASNESVAILLMPVIPRV